MTATGAAGTPPRGMCRGCCSEQDLDQVEHPRPDRGRYYVKAHPGPAGTLCAGTGRNPMPPPPSLNGPPAAWWSPARDAWVIAGHAHGHAPQHCPHDLASCCADCCPIDTPDAG